eukprot:scaffold14311_cov44-Phaeocystis_antarctica.AAC.2
MARVPSSLQNGVLSLQTGAGRKRCALHVSRSANCDTQFAKWYSLQIRCASSATSLHTELLSREICKLRPGMQTVLRSHPVWKLGSVCRLSRCADCAQHIYRPKVLRLGAPRMAPRRHRHGHRTLYRVHDSGLDI